MLRLVGRNGPRGWNQTPASNSPNTSNTMTPRQRILATLNHEPPDRTPTDGWFHPEVIESLKRHYDTDDWSVVLDELGIEGWADLSPHLAPVAPDGQIIPQMGHASGEPAKWLDERTYEDVWGVRFRKGDDDRYREWLSGPLEDAQTAADIERFGIDRVVEICQPDDYSEQVAQLKKEEKFVFANVENPFRRLWNLRGYENALMDYVANVEVLEAVYDPLYELYTGMATQIARAGVDMIRVIGDFAMQDRIIMRPALWRQFDKPRMAALIAAARQVNPDVTMFIHSDGKLTDLMDDLIEIGFDVINPIQPECMDPLEVKRRWGDRITLHGCISIQRTLPFGSVDDVRHEVETLIRQCGHNGGLVLLPSNNIQPDTPIENILACYHTARDFAVSSI